MRKRKEHQPLEAGEKQFFQRFYEENKNFMYYIASQHVPISADREDLVQDALERLMRNISTLEGIEHRKAAKYIVLTIRTAYLDGERRRKKENVIYLDEETLAELMLEDLWPQDPDHTLSVNQSVALLRSGLTTREWCLLEGKYVMGFDQDELATLVGVAPDSVRMILHRAREKAKGILRQEAAKEGNGNG